MRFIHSGDAKQLFGEGITTGLLAGIIFAAALMLFNAILGWPLLGPLRVIGSLALGPEALRPDYPTSVALWTGAAVLLILSMFFGIVFVSGLYLAGQLTGQRDKILAQGIIFGFTLWLVNILLGSAGFPQLLRINQFWHGFVAHTFFFGAVIAWLVVKFRRFFIVK